MQELLRILVVDSQPIVGIVLQTIINADPLLRDVLEVSTASSLIDALDAGREHAPDLLLVDTGIWANSTCGTPVNLFRAVSALRQICRTDPAGVMLVHDGTASITPALILLYKKRVSAIVGKDNVSSQMALYKAIQATLRQQSYIYLGKPYQLAELMPGQEFHTLSPASIQIIEMLYRYGTAQKTAEMLSISNKSIYRYLNQLAHELGLERWQFIADYAQESGIIDNGRVVCNCILRRQYIHQTRRSASGTYAWM